MSEILSATGVVLAAAAAAAAILLPPGRLRAAAMLTALALFPLLILGDQWHSPQIADLRDEPTLGIALALTALATATLTLAAAFHRWQILLPLAVVAALPFRVPIAAGGDTANLLVPLYLVIAAGVLASAFAAWRGSRSSPPTSHPPGTEEVDPDQALAEGYGGAPAGAASRFSQRQLSESQGPPGEKPSARWGPPIPLLPLALAAVVLLYALQTLYSPDFSKSLQNTCFFFIPFALAFALLREVEWNRRLLTLVLAVVATEALAFIAVGSLQYATRELFWNDQVIRSNEFHTYFRVNSIFWDPNIYGRYLALAIVVATAVLLWARERRTLALLTGLLALLWVGLVPTFSQSSFAALLGGLAALAAVRWSARWTLAAVGAGAALAILVVLFAGGNTTITPSRINVDTGGRANLVSGGAELFARRPVWGHGAGSFPRAYREHIATRKAPVSVSHTEPVTVAAEQGLIGLIAYTTLLLTALWTMARGLGRGVPPQELVSSPRQEPVRQSRRGFRRWDPTAHDTAPTTLDAIAIGHIAVLAAFVALLVHTMAYAGFYEDPIAWVLLAIGASLAARPVRAET